MSLEIILELIYLWSQGFSQGEIVHELKLSNKTVTEWTNFFSCISAVIDNSTPIGGNGIELEIDESKFGKRKYHKGHKVEGQWVFFHIGDHAGYLAEFMWRSSNCDKDKFLQLITDINDTFKRKYLCKLPSC